MEKLGRCSRSLASYSESVSELYLSPKFSNAAGSLAGHAEYGVIQEWIILLFALPCLRLSSCNNGFLYVMD